MLLGALSGRLTIGLVAISARFRHVIGEVPGGALKFRDCGERFQTLLFAKGVRLVHNRAALSLKVDFRQAAAFDRERQCRR
jgi:hypothetical protein